MTLRAVEIAETARGFRVSTDCQSRAEAIAAALALFNAPAATAFQQEPPPACMGDSGEFNDWSPELPVAPEGHPALADAEDNVGALKAGEAG